MNTVWGEPKWICFPVHLLTACWREVFRAIYECFLKCGFFCYFLFKSLFLMIIFLYVDGLFFRQAASFRGDCIPSRAGCGPISSHGYGSKLEFRTYSSLISWNACSSGYPGHFLGCFDSRPVAGLLARMGDQANRLIKLKILPF
jgi:hypothetical protein